MNTPPSSSSRLPRPAIARSSPSSSSTTKNVSPSASSSTSAKTSKSRSRSKSHLSQPKILPFPELSLRAQEAQRTSREGSRATSPMSTPPIDRLEVTFDQLVSMSRGGSSEGVSHTRLSTSGGSSNTTTTPVPSSGIAGSTSPPIPSPLALSAARLSRARASTVPTRPRTPGGTTAISTTVTTSTGEATSSTSASPSSSSRAMHPSIGTATGVAHRRTEGFRPNSPAVARVTTNSFTPSSSSVRPTPVIAPSTPTSVPAAPAQARSAPTSSGLPPAIPVSATKVHPSSHPSHTTHLSHQPTSSATTVAVSPAPTNGHIKDHLYHSLLKGTCADVRLIIRAWGVCYHVHKMILAQTNFFHTLFLGGFSEARGHSVRRNGKGKERAGDQRLIADEEWSGEDVELTFDDPNIARAAFEICLSRLYSPYPHLHFPADLLPTSTHPLTPSFPNISSTPDCEALGAASAPKTQLITPRLLLSLLATTVYLGHSVLMREVLSVILRTVGPLTVGRYLAFALGDGMGEEEYPDQTSQGIKSFSGVAKHILHEEDDASTLSRQTSDEDLMEDELHTINHTPRSSSDSGKIGSSSEESLRHGGVTLPLPHYYGMVGNKIGEACCCWLARWGLDILKAEMQHTSAASSACKIWAYGGLPAHLVRAVISSDYFYVPNEMERYGIARKVLELRRSGWEEETQDEGHLLFPYGKSFPSLYILTFDDLSTIASDIDPSTHLPYAPLPVLQAAHWAAADLRSRVTAHERSGNPANSADEEGELGLTQSTSAICAVSRRRRPATRSRVPSPAMTASPWSSTTMPASPSSTIDGLPSLSAAQQTIWHAVPTDETHKIGASGLTSSFSTSTTSTSGLSSQSQSQNQLQNTVLSDMPDFGPDPLDPLYPPSHPAHTQSQPIIDKSQSKRVPHGERNAFGLIGTQATGKEIEERWMNEGGLPSFAGLTLSTSPTMSLSPSPNSKIMTDEERWTKIQPYRFAVEFFDIDKLTEKERFYSTTHFYAGSYFNCYVQMIKRKEKGLQLGVYLHRQSPNEPFPTPSQPRSASSSTPASITTSSVSALTHGSHGHTRNPSTNNIHLSASAGSPPPILSMSLSPPHQSNLNSHTDEDTNTTTTSKIPPPPYLDSRSTTKAYFSISCASALGTSLIRFTSGPDSFALSQSWGWKSSALKSEEYLCVPTSPSPLTPPQDAQGQGIQAQNSELGQEGGQAREQDVLGWVGDFNSDHNSVNPRVGQCSLRATVVVGVV
uniref:BTB domain-containing protein n=1 Tax=Kwoniella dejecticola CBS 10117 TaxID=1296121 RepID=A0A1A6AGW8_9TREE|nr:uncharacterized protein I303_01135 [Kwoniella dejecticola CBS 10117]OBR89309.1 hypothetical protein I303_01135 [Kwoniella dejecticola CBS 10117]